ncbi:synaptotagmin-like protein 2 [Rhincodon typus]|uniref:synaptotagmin-like protein 2 n=1 Tax=Rhincodon typus TaxID=259920 RepID=UPI00202FB9B4|nr:synaptotagmin-like protein 2 [Rhincodon typus]
MKGVMDSHLDLSFLTEDEYQMLLKVIQRDSELKKKDSERIRTAQKSIQDEKRRKLVTGLWFEEVKAKRYRNSLLGVDLIKASIRRKKPITHDTTQKSESQQTQLSRSYPIPNSSQTATYEESRLLLSNLSLHQIFSIIMAASDRIESHHGAGIDKLNKKKRQQKDHAGPRVSTPVSEPTVEWQKRAKSVDSHYPETYQNPMGSDILTELQMRHTSSVSRIPRRINSIGTPGDLSRTEESRTPNDLTFDQDHVHGSQRIPAGFSTKSPIGEESPDTMKQDNDAGSSYDAKQANQASEIRDQRTASPEGNSQTPREQSHLEFTGETWKAAEEPEHSNLNGQGLITVSAVVSPMNEKALDVPKSKKSLATHYKGAPTYKIPESSDKGKMHTSNITQIPKSDRTSRESETVTTKKPEGFASESGPQGLSSAKTNEDQQAYNTLEKLNLSPTSRIPRLKIALETAGETPKIPIEDLKPLSRQLAGQNGTTEVTDQAKAAFQPTSRIAKYQSSSSDDEREKGHKQGAVFTINALGNRHLEEEALTDPNRFKSLRHFWEKGIESNKANSELPSNVSKIPFRRLRSPDYKSCPTEVKQSTTPESKSALVTKEIPSTNSYPKSELQGNQSIPHSSEEGEAVPLTWTSKLPPVPAARARPTVKIGKSDAWMTKWDQHADTTPSMVDEVSKINVPQAHSDDNQTKDSIAVESIEHGKATTLMHSKHSSLDESLSVMKSSQTPADCIVEEPIKKEILPAKEIERKEMYEKIKKMALESAKDDTPSKEELTMRKDDDKVCNESPILLYNDYKSELRTPADNYTIRLDEEGQVCPKERDEEIILRSSQSDLPTLEQDVAPGKNDCTNIPLKSQAETLVEKSPEGDPVEPQTILQYNKHLLPRSVSEVSTWLDTKAHSGDAKVRTSSTDEFHYSVNLKPVTVRKPITIASTEGSEADLMGNALNSNSSAQEEESSNVVHRMDDSEGPIYGLSPVMKALARAKKNNAKSMDNLNSTVDRETITSSVDESEVKRDAMLRQLQLSVVPHLYKIEKSVLLIQKLNLSVWHNDTLGRNSFLGEVDVDLGSWDWSNRELNWYLLKSRCPMVGVGVDHRGEINLAIKYVPPGSLGAGDPPTGEVHIWMKNAKDLPQLRSSGVDSFVKCYVLPDTSKKSYQKTRIVKKDTNPIYNHTIVYDGFRTEDLKEACVELTVWDHEKLTNHFLGGLRLGFGTGYSYGIPVEWMDSTEEETALWQEMVSNPNEWIPGSLLLRSQLGGKKLK